MKAVSIAKIKKELKLLNEDEHAELILKLARFKKDNKELLTYLLFEAEDENGFIEVIKEEMDALFAEINTNHIYYVRKSSRKVLRNVKKYIRYSKMKTTEASLLIYFCQQLKKVMPTHNKSSQLENMFNRQILAIEKAISTMHEDLQYDFRKEIEILK